MSRHHTRRGQAAVELVALLPAVVLLALIGWHIALAAHTWIAAGSAARAGARAHEVGAGHERAARSALGGRALGVEARVDSAGRTHIEVRVLAPRAAPWLPAISVRGRAAARGGATP